VPKFRLFLLFFLLGCFTASAQPDFTLPLVKPKKYENKTLGSEKTEDKKFTLPRKLYQSMVTHYNFYYNATNKINAILERAKASHRDDYTQLLPFYNYSTTITAADSAELDSVIYKATAGIVLHDLRNSYIDDMYLLIGKSYFYWQKYDSAYRIFQFINYNFFPKGKDEYIIVVGANDRSTKGDLNIATKENNNLLHRAFTKAPSRNDALIWLARTYAQDNLFPETYSLVNLLKKDPTFPKRLHGKLNEVQAYSFYKQEQWDSTAFYLKNALTEAADKTELARWEYLLAQLYAKTNQPGLASEYFNKAKAHTTDPVLYIHARIYEAQLVKKEGETVNMDETLADLLKLSKKERFDGYEDVLFYAAAGAALQKGDTTQAMNLLKRSVTYQTENPSVKNQAYVKLSELAYHRKDYVLASSSLDSVNLGDPSLTEVNMLLQTRQEILKQVVTLQKTVFQQDSLQRIAQLPEKEMDMYLRSLVRKLRKERGLKEEINFVPAVLTGNQETNAPLFAASGNGNNWYFYNASQKSKGYNEFRARWGNRPNVDNWRRQTAVDASVAVMEKTTSATPSSEENTDAATIPEDELTVEGLKKRLPIGGEALLTSGKKIADALFEQGQIYKNQLEDYAQAVAVFEELLKRFGNYEKEEEVLFELFYCYNKLGDKQRAAFFQQELKKKYPNGDPVQKITAANNPVKPGKDEKTIVYERIYDLFISGKFDEALQQKKLADSVYGNSYWTPQLLYIESLYHIKQKNDSVAIVTLTNLERNFPGSPMAEKAAIMKDVVSRRAEIEDYLTNTNIVRQTEDSIVMPFDEGPKVNMIVQEKKQQDNKITGGNQPTQNNANITRPAAPVQKTEVEKTDRNNAGKITIAPKPAKDTTTLKPIKEAKAETAYIYNSNEPYTVLIYFDQVDPVYISEAKNAFQRYNNSSHAGETIGLKVNDAEKEKLWMEMGMFSDVTIAMGYMDEWKKNARQIVPWLAESKYNFIVISERNLELLKTRKNMEEYKLFLRQHIKDKF
ncbi:MAG: tetratricopeptide repeat protein, partial [Lacibacter sp.]